MSGWNAVPHMQSDGPGPRCVVNSAAALAFSSPTTMHSTFKRLRRLRIEPEPHAVVASRPPPVLRSRETHWIAHERGARGFAPSGKTRVP